jgi:choice-of-anchor C domain-containing protein
MPVGAWAQLNLVTDGSFEIQVARPNFERGYAPSVWGGWTISAGSVDIINGYWNASQGVQSVDLAGSSSGTIQQTIPNAFGTQYRLSFDLSGNPDGPDGAAALKRVSVSFGGVSRIFEFGFTASATHPYTVAWATQVWELTTINSDRSLVFQDITADGINGMGAVIDNVVLTPIPEPGVCLLLGLAGAAWMARRLWRP